MAGNVFTTFHQSLLTRLVSRFTENSAAAFTYVDLTAGPGFYRPQLQRSKYYLDGISKMYQYNPILMLDYMEVERYRDSLIVFEHLAAKANNEPNKKLKYSWDAGIELVRQAGTEPIPNVYRRRLGVKEALDAISDEDFARNEERAAEIARIPPEFYDELTPEQREMLTTPDYPSMETMLENLEIPAWNPRFIPSSLDLVRLHMRAKDRAIANESEAPNFDQLANGHFKDSVGARTDPRVRLLNSQLDGKLLDHVFPAITAHGVVNVEIDPLSTEDEMLNLAQLTAAAVRKWPHATFVVNYPIYKSKPIDLYRTLVASGSKNIFNAQMLTNSPFDRYAPNEQADGDKDDEPIDLPPKEFVEGTGTVVINPPYGFKEEMDRMVPVVTQALGGLQPDQQQKYMFTSDGAQHQIVLGNVPPAVVWLTPGSDPGVVEPQVDRFSFGRSIMNPPPRYEAPTEDDLLEAELREMQRRPRGDEPDPELDLFEGMSNAEIKKMFKGAVPTREMIADKFAEIAVREKRKEGLNKLIASKYKHAFRRASN